MADPQQQLFQYLQMLIGSGGIGNLDSSGNPEPYDLGTASQEGTLYNKQDGLIGSLLFGGTPGGSDPATFEDVVTYEPVKDFMTDPLNRYLGEGSEGSIESLIAQLIRSGQSQGQIIKALDTPPEGGVSPLASLGEEELERVTSLVGEMHSSRSDYNEWKDQVPASERDQNDEPLSRLEVRTKSPAAQKYADAGIPHPFEQWRDDDLANVSGSQLDTDVAAFGRDQSMQALKDLQKELSNAQQTNFETDRSQDRTPGDIPERPDTGRPLPSYMTAPSYRSDGDLTSSWSGSADKLGKVGGVVGRAIGSVFGGDGNRDGVVYGRGILPNAGKNSASNTGRIDTTGLMQQMEAARTQKFKDNRAWDDARIVSENQKERAGYRRKNKESTGQTPHMTALMNQMMAQRGLGQ
jgi:hypothetical protein